MPRFKQTEAGKDLENLYLEGLVTLRTTMAEVYEMRESFSKMGKDRFKSNFYRFIGEKRKEGDKNGGAPKPAGK